MTLYIQHVCLITIHTRLATLLVFKFYRSRSLLCSFIVHISCFKKSMYWYTRQKHEVAGQKLPYSTNYRWQAIFQVAPFSNYIVLYFYSWKLKALMISVRTEWIFFKVFSPQWNWWNKLSLAETTSGSFCTDGKLQFTEHSTTGWTKSFLTT